MGTAMPEVGSYMVCLNNNKEGKGAGHRRENEKMGEHEFGDIPQETGHAGLGRHGKECGLYSECDGDPLEVPCRADGMK